MDNVDHRVSHEPVDFAPMAASRLRLVASSAWCVAFVTWLASAGLTFDRLTLVFWVVTALVAFTLGTRPWWQAPLDWMPFIIFFLVYDYTRGVATSLGVPTHWELPARIDQMLGFGQVPTVWLQEHLAEPATRIPWWERLTGATYVSFFVVPIVLGAVLWLRSRADFASFMLRFTLISAIALTGYVLVPAAPPWAAARCTHAEVVTHPSNPRCMYDSTPEHRGHTVLKPLTSPREGFSPIVKRISPRGWYEIPGLRMTSGFLKTGIDASNRVAAIPSLHAATAMFISVFLWPRVRRRWRLLLGVYPVAMAFTLVWGGDHYVFDVLLGWLAVLVAMRLAGWIERRLGSRRIGERMSRPGGRGARKDVEESPDSVERRWWLTATHGDVRDSATEIKPPTALRGTGKGETVR